MDIQIINPLNYPNWDDLLLANEDHSFFHTRAWAEVLCETYGYKPLYFASLDGSHLRMLVPIMETNSFLTGKRGVSLPFTDFCDVVFEEKTEFTRLMQKVLDYGQKLGWKYVEVRGGEKYFDGVHPYSIYHVHTVDLNREAVEILRSFRDSTSRNVKKAKKKGVEVTFSHGLAAIRSYYYLHCKTRKRQGIPPQPYAFFEKIHRTIIAQGMGFVTLAIYEDKPIAGAVHFHFGKKAIFKYGAFDIRYQEVRPNNLVLWQSMKWYADRGYQSYSLGRTEVENSGLLQFKGGWGATEELIKYYRYDFRREKYVKGRRGSVFTSKMLKMLPGPLFRLIGTCAYRHAA